MNQFLSKNTKFIIFSLVVLFGLASIAWRQHGKEKRFEQDKLQSERSRIGAALRQAGVAAAKSQQEAENKQIVQEDALAPHELSGDAELVQAKLWQSLPKDKREIMETETINAGLAAANKEQPIP